MNLTFVYFKSKEDGPAGFIEEIPGTLVFGATQEDICSALYVRLFEVFDENKMRANAFLEEAGDNLEGVLAETIQI